MSSDLVPMNPALPQRSLTAVDIDAMWRQCERLSTSSLVPKAYFRKPENILLVADLGRVYGWSPGQSMQNCHVIEGTPSIKPLVMMAMVRAARHSVQVIKSDGNECTLHGKRADTGDEATVTYSLAEAKQAGLLNKSNWRAYAEDMLFARCTSRLCRRLFQDVVLSAGYVPEELGAAVDRHGAVIDAVEIHDRRSATTVPVAALTGPGSDPVDAVIVEDGPITPDQMKLLSAVLADTGIVDKKQRLDVIEAILGRPIDSAKNLTENAADAVIGVLDAIVAEHRPADTDQPLAVVLAAVEAWS